MFDVQVYGDRGVRVQLGDSISIETNERIRSFSSLLEQENIEGVTEWIPTYTAISIFYNPLKISFETLRERLSTLNEKLSSVEIPPAELIKIPVCYGGPYGSDLPVVAKHNQLKEEEVVQIHTGTNYLIYMMGFSPGFPYLGGMSEQIATPRLESPRPKTAAGSVGIAGSQTGIYPSDSPGGWQIIGRTPLTLYKPESDPPILLRAGNYVRFFSIGEKEYEEIARSVAEGIYQLETKPCKGGSSS